MTRYRERGNARPEPGANPGEDFGVDEAKGTSVTLQRVISARQSVPNVPSQSQGKSRRKPKVLRNLRAFAKLATSRTPTFDVFELTQSDLLPSQAWRIGWWWWDYANPAPEGIGVFDESAMLPLPAHGPFKTPKRATQAAQTYIAANPRQPDPTEPLDSAGDC